MGDSLLRTKMSIEIEGTETGVIYSAQIAGKNHLLITMSGKRVGDEEDITTTLLVKIVDSRRISDSLQPKKTEEAS